MSLIYVDLKYVSEPKARKLLGPKRSRWQPWRVLVLSGDNFKPLFKGSERWTNKEDAFDAIHLAFGDESNVYLRQEEHGNIQLRLARPL